MPRFFFDIKGETSQSDPDGVVLDDADQARIEGETAALELKRDLEALNQSTSGIVVQVRDRFGTVIVEFSLDESVLRDPD